MISNLHEQSQHSPSPARSKAFTILENLIVLGILFVLTMVLVALYLHHKDGGTAPDETRITPSTSDSSPTSPSGFRFQSTPKTSE